MNLIDNESLAGTLDAVNDAFLHGTTIPKKSRLEVAEWIAARQGLPGAYAGLFAPTEKDFRKGIRLFTGEKLGTRAGIAHILGEEAARALILLGTPHSNERAALERASIGMVRRLQEHERPESGRYCCGKCTCALWRMVRSTSTAALTQSSRPGSTASRGRPTIRSRRSVRGSSPRRASVLSPARPGPARHVRLVRV